jgi:hypothetical protein
VKAQITKIGKAPHTDRNSVRTDTSLVFETPRGGLNGKVTVEFESKSQGGVTEEEMEEYSTQALQYLQSELAAGRILRAYYRLRNGIMY